MFDNPSENTFMTINLETMLNLYSNFIENVHKHYSSLDKQIIFS